MRVVGVMSGTSVDAIDVVVAEVSGSPEEGGAPLSVRQLAFETVPWPPQQRSLIFDLFAGNGTPADLCRANFALAETFAAAISSVLEHAGLDRAGIDLIGCHGQTIWHDVQNGHVTSTLQIGTPAVIAERTGVTTAGNFRVADVAAGGHGAPLVSTFDWHCLRPPDPLNGMAGGWRAVQNIGGIGNVTFLPPAGMDAPPLAFDTGPGNALIDWAAGYATGGELSFDEDGLLAGQGRILEALVTKWLAHPYFAQVPPKTTGRELFSNELAAEWQADVAALGASTVDCVATITALTAASIADAYARFAPGPVAQVAVGGGGARNPALMGELRRRLAMRLDDPIEVVTQAALGIDPDAKEALAFGLLAYLCLHGWPGNVPACTGARHAQILGELAPGSNYRQLLSIRQHS